MKKIFITIISTSIILLTIFGRIHLKDKFGLVQNWLPTEKYGSTFEKVSSSNINDYSRSLEIQEWTQKFYSKETNIPQLFKADAPKKYKSDNRQFGHVYGNYLTTYGVYSGCRFETDKNNNVRKFYINDCSTDFVNDNHKPINGWEHINPQSILNKGTFFPELAKADLNNLRPSLLYQYNSPRSNHLFTSFLNKGYKLGVMFKVGISPKNKSIVCEPRNEVKGDIARITFYMHDIYHLTYENNYYKLLIKWHNMDPVDEYERRLNELNKEVMGIGNMYIEKPYIAPH